MSFSMYSPGREFMFAALSPILDAPDKSRGTAILAVVFVRNTRARSPCYRLLSGASFFSIQMPCR